MATAELTRLGRLLLGAAGAGGAWRVRLLGAAGDVVDRLHFKEAIDQSCREAAAAQLIVIAGTVVHGAEGIALVTGELHREYPEDSTLPLAWIGARLQRSASKRLVMVASVELAAMERSAARDAMPPMTWLTLLSTERAEDLLVLDAVGGEHRALAALCDALCGDAIDPRTGTITFASVSAALAAQLPGAEIRTSSATETLSLAPPLDRLFELGLSRRSWHEPATTATVPTPRATVKPEVLLGTVLPGRFRVDVVIARGSFGVVYRARQLTVERDVAVKVLHTNLAPSSEESRLFVQEIQAVGRIDHPGVVRIYQADITRDGALFFAMELLEGCDLQRVVEAGLVEPARAVALTRQLLAALAAAHDCGLIHADVKPANAIVVAGRAGERLVLVDFGLARLRQPGHCDSTSIGGTPAYMAPEQLLHERVDARSDLFSAALVLVTMLTGWRRTRAAELVPPLDAIADPALRRVLERALAVTPAERYQSATELAAALTGETTEPARPVAPAPFRRLAPFTERDRGHLVGRDPELNLLTEHALFRRACVFTAPSGTGKTSLLRAGLVPRLEALGVRALYLSCRSLEAVAAGASLATALIDALAPGATSIAGAIEAWQRSHAGRAVIILDHLEIALLDGEPAPELLALLAALLTAPAGVDHRERGPVAMAGEHVTDEPALVLSVREDFLARLLAGVRTLDATIPVLRLGPLPLARAREAITRPLAEHRIAIEPALLDALLADLAAGAAALAPELGWGPATAVYPPHLQLACAALYESLDAGEVTLTLAHYRQLGGFDAIVGEHLDRVLDTELDAAAAALARDVFLALVTTAQNRAVRTEQELLELAFPAHQAALLPGVLETLRAQGLLVRARRADAEPVWELVHDSLVPRVLRWIDRRDLARRHAVELVRYHLRRSRPEAPSLLSRAELIELSDHGDALAELDAEWAHRHAPRQMMSLTPNAAAAKPTAEPWTPSRLVRRSRSVVRRQLAASIALALTVLASIGAVLYERHRITTARRADELLRDLDLGHFVLELSPFDWDTERLAAVPVAIAELPGLTWTLHEPSAEDPASPGQPLTGNRLLRHPAHLADDGLTRHEPVEAPGGAAFLMIAGRGRRGERCAPSIVPVRALPGYAQRRAAEPTRLRVRVPTCQATLADTLEIPAGPFLYGGPGAPPSALVIAAGVEAPAEQRVDLPAFHCDRTEVSNAAFAVLGELADVTGLPASKYVRSPELARAAEPRVPVTFVSWTVARAYCRFLGKDLLSTQQWQKALRGGLTLPDGRPNPSPRRNFAWGNAILPGAARIRDGSPAGVVEIATYPLDVSPYLVRDLVGNVQEWTRSPPIDGTPGYRTVRGSSWDILEHNPEGDLVDIMAIENPRALTMQSFDIGLRCGL